MRYHICKQTRLYDGEPYRGPSSDYEPAGSDSLDNAIMIAECLQARNAVGWNVFDSETDELVYGYNYFQHKEV